MNLLLKMGLIKVDGLLAREFIQDGGCRTWLVKDDECVLKKVIQMRSFTTTVTYFQTDPCSRFRHLLNFRSREELMTS